MENKKISIEFTKEELLAIAEFLSRVQLSGIEVPAFVSINNKFSFAEKELTEQKKDKK